MENFSAHYLANATRNSKMFELARTNNFRFYVEGLGGLLRAGYQGQESNAYIPDNADETLEFSVKSFTVPKFKQEVIEIRRGNAVMKAAGLPSFEDGSLVVDDFIGADGKSILMSWQNLSYNVQTQMVGYMKDYKRDCYLIEYDPNYKEVRTWKLYGCWVSDLSQDAFDHDNGDKRQITATITYDWAKMEMPDEE
jgi:hypothetical protein